MEKSSYAEYLHSEYFIAEEHLDEFDIETSVGFLLAKANQRLFASLRDLLAPVKITPPQFALLAFLWQEDGRSQRVLSEKTEVDRTTLSGLLDRLQKQGLVRRSPDPQDRRAWQIYLTERGRKLEGEVTPLVAELRRQVANDLTPAEYDELCRLLTKLRRRE